MLLDLSKTAVINWENVKRDNSFGFPKGFIDDEIEKYEDISKECETMIQKEAELEDLCKHNFAMDINRICEMQRTIDYYEYYLESLSMMSANYDMTIVSKGTYCDDYVKRITKFIKEVNKT